MFWDHFVLSFVTLNDEHNQLGPLNYVGKCCTIKSKHDVNIFVSGIIPNNNEMGAATESNATMI